MNLNANSCSIGQNKRRKGPHWPRSVDKIRFSDFLKFEHRNRHTAFGIVMIKLQFEAKPEEI